MRTSFIASALLLLAATSYAQQDRAIEQIERELDQLEMSRTAPREGWTLGEGVRGLWGVYTTFSFLAADDDLSQTRMQRQVDSRIWGRAYWGGHEVYGRLRLRYRDYNTGDQFGSQGDGLTEPIGDLYWYRYRSRAARGGPTGFDWWIQAGRQYIQWEQGVVLSAPLYAVQGGFETKGWMVKGLVGRTPRTGSIDYDASRPGFDRQVDRYWWGAELKLVSSTKHQPFLYYLGQQDENPRVGVFQGVPTIFLYDSQYAALGSNGSLTGVSYYRTELIYEWGEGASDPFAGAQTIENISAFAFRLLYVLSPRDWASWGGRFEVEVLLGSGDTDRGQSAFTPFGNQPGTDDNSFNAFGYVNTGLALAPALANLLSVRIGLNTTLAPRSSTFRRAQLALDVFFFNTLNSNAATSMPTNQMDSFIGVEVDLTFTWQMASDLYLDIRYGVFFPGEAMLTGFDKDRHFFYAGLSYAF